MSPDEEIAAIAARQHGAFTNRQARKVGFTGSAIDHRRRTGRWRDLHIGVYAMSGVPATDEQRVIAAVMALGPRAAAAGPTAAWLLGVVAKPTALVHVVMPSGQHRRNRKGFVIVEAALVRSDMRTVKGIRCTGPERTIVDLAAVLSRRALEAALDEAALLGLTTLPKLRRYIRERRLGHRPGAKVLRELLEDRTHGVSYKELEKIFLRKLRSARLPEPVRQHPEGKYFIDVAYPDARVAIELAGRAFHFSGRSFRDDPRRRNQLVLAGWHVFEFTWEDVDERWTVVEATIRRALAD